MTIVPTYLVTFEEKDTPGYGAKMITYELDANIYSTLQAVLHGQVRIVPLEQDGTPVEAEPVEEE